MVLLRTGRRMTTLENKHRPRRFSEYKGGGWPLELVKNLVAGNRHSAQGGKNPYRVSNLLLYGNSSCGKTTLALLYARATLCPNRDEGTAEPCGTCPVCTGEDITNIYHHTIANPSDSHSIIEGFIERAACYPSINSDRPDQQRQFFIIDEFELASTALASRLLESLEFTPDTTTWILCSMDIEKLRSNRQMYEAITSRCVEVPLQPVTVELIAQELHEREGVGMGAALAIAELCNSNFRRAWQTIAALRTTKDIITEEDVYSHIAGGASDEERGKLWRALRDGNGKIVQNLLHKWQVDPVVLANLLVQDIVNNLHEPDESVQRLLLDLSKWYGHKHFPLVAVLIANLGATVVPTRVAPPVVKSASELINLIKPLPKLINPSISLGDLWKS